MCDEFPVNVMLAVFAGGTLAAMTGMVFEPEIMRLRWRAVRAWRRACVKWKAAWMKRNRGNN